MSDLPPLLDGLDESLVRRLDEAATFGDAKGQEDIRYLSVQHQSTNCEEISNSEKELLKPSVQV